MAVRTGTRERILEVALHLFSDRGYAGTSIRDIAEELDITKAAVHYHFAAKEQIVMALVDPVFVRLAEVVEQSREEPPRVVLTRISEVLAAAGPIFEVMSSDPSVAAASPHLHADVEALALRTAEVLAGPGASPARRLRAHAALGALAAGSKFAGAQGKVAGAATCVAPDAQALEVVLDAALAALGDVEPRRRATS